MALAIQSRTSSSDLMITDATGQFEGTNPPVCRREAAAIAQVEYA
jgi:hypothetical protein